MNIYPPALSIATLVSHSSNSSHLSLQDLVVAIITVRQLFSGRRKQWRAQGNEAVAPGLNTQLDYGNDSLYICLSLGEDHKRSSHCRSRSGSRKIRDYSVGLGRSQSGGLSGQDDADLSHSKTEDKILNVGLIYK